MTDRPIQVEPKHVKVGDTLYTTARTYRVYTIDEVFPRGIMFSGLRDEYQTFLSWESFSVNKPLIPDTITVELNRGDAEKWLSNPVPFTDENLWPPAVNIRTALRAALGDSND